MVPHIYHTSFILIPFPCAALHSAALLTAPRFKLNTMATRTFRCDADKTFIRFCFVFCLFVGGGGCQSVCFDHLKHLISHCDRKYQKQVFQITALILNFLLYLMYMVQVLIDWLVGLWA